MKLKTENNIWNLLRLSISSIMLWAFFDKLLGLNFATASNKSWLAGVSPTAGFLKFAPDGLFAPIFNSLSGNFLIDVLFMSGLFLIGLCLLLGIGVKIACYCGALMMFLIYLSLFPPQNNPLIDEHIVYILVFILLAERSRKQSFGLSSRWDKISLVKKYPILQ